MIDIKENLFNCVENKQECNVYSKPITQKYKNYIDNIETEPKEYNINYRLVLKIKIDLAKFQKVHKKEKYDNHIKNNNHTIVFILMNASHASGENSDGTINNCIEIAGYNNYSNIEIYNLSPLRTPKPECLNKKLILECPAIANKTEKEKQEIKKIIDDLDKQNKKKLEEVANSNNKTIVVAWGGLKNDKDAKRTEYEFKKTIEYFLQLCQSKNKTVLCIKDNKSIPQHPSNQSKVVFNRYKKGNEEWGKLSEFNIEKCLTKMDNV